MSTAWQIRVTEEAERALSSVTLDLEQIQEIDAALGPLDPGAPVDPGFGRSVAVVLSRVARIAAARGYRTRAARALVTLLERAGRWVAAHPEYAPSPRPLWSHAAVRGLDEHSMMWDEDSLDLELVEAFLRDDALDRYVDTGAAARGRKIAVRLASLLDIRTDEPARSVLRMWRLLRGT